MARRRIGSSFGGSYFPEDEGDFGERWYPRQAPVAVQRARSGRALEKLSKKRTDVAPIAIEGRTIARTFWGRAWCENLERYSDYSNRLPRGRTYVRSGAVVDLQIEPKRVRALVQGSSLYEVEIEISAIAPKSWRQIVDACAGSIDSLVQLLSGSLSDHVMQTVTRPGDGLFPTPREIELNCSCPDWATMCKHVAAVMYGIGARLDREPGLLFRLRGVDPQELTSGGKTIAAITDPSRVAKDRRLDAGDLGAVFGIALDEEEAPATPPPAREKKSRAPTSPARVLLDTRELAALGVDDVTMGSWLASQLLLRTGERERYAIPDAAMETVAAHIIERCRVRR